MVRKQSSIPETGPYVVTIEFDGDVPVRSQCKLCGAVFDAGQEHSVTANYAALHEQWIRHCKSTHPIED